MDELFYYRLGQKRGGSSGGGVTIKNQNKTITANGTYKADSGYTGLGTVNVNVPASGITPSGTIEITANGNYDVTNYASASVNVAASGGGGDASVEDGIIDRSIAGEYANSRIETIGPHAFDGCGNLTTVNFPAATTIEAYAFQDCGSLAAVNFPAAVSINNSAFRICTSLIAVDFPAVTFIDTNAFHGCSGLTAANFPKLKTVETYAFRNCTKLTAIDFPVIEGIKANVFIGCSALDVLVLRRSSLVALLNTSAFSGTPFESGGDGGIVLAPASLVAQYQSATNWTKLYGYGTNKFLALEDYTVDGTTTGAIDWDKLNAA